MNAQKVVDFSVRVNRVWREIRVVAQQLWAVKFTRTILIGLMVFLVSMSGWCAFLKRPMETQNIAQRVAGPKFWPSVPVEAGQVFPFQPSARYAVGAARVTMSADELQDRSSAYIASLTFKLLKRPEMVSAPPLLEKLQPTMKSAIAQAIAENQAKTNPVKDTSWLTPELLTAMAWLESQGKCDAESGADCAGLTQIARNTATELGLTVRPPVYKTVGRGRHKRSVLVKPGVDERLHPEKALLGTCRYLLARYRIYGRADVSVASYHLGAGNVAKFFRTYYGLSDASETEVAAKFRQTGDSYADVFFRHSPTIKPDMWRLVWDYTTGHDEGATYYFRVECARYLWRYYQSNSAGFRHLAAAQKRYDGQDARIMFTTWYEQTDVPKYRTMADLQKARAGGELLPVPSCSSSSCGYSLALNGRNVIAELDKDNQESYVVLQQDGITTLLELAETYRLMSPRSESLRITSLTRSMDYQTKLKQGNTNALTGLPTHTIGRAFDISRAKANGQSWSAEEERVILFTLSEFQSIGRLSFTDKESGCWHVAVPPDRPVQSGLPVRPAVILASR